MKHIIHFEDIIFEENMKNVIDDLFTNVFTCYNEDKFTIKYDGSPAIIFGNNPFFIATKSFFNNIPKKYFSIEQIQNDNIDEELKQKLISAFIHLKDYKGIEILQGDYLYDKNSIYETKFNGDTYYSFTPNTITYHIRKESETGKRIKYSTFGMAFHTTIRGQNSISITSHIKKQIERIKNTFIPKITSSFTPTNELLFLLHTYYMNYSNIKFQTFSKELKENVQVYINKHYRNGIKPEFTSSDFTIKFRSFINERLINKMNSYKTQKSKNRILNEIKEVEGIDFKSIFEVYSLFLKIKEEVIRCLHANDDILCMINDEITPHEGFVYSDDSITLKFVNRNVFSYQNFKHDHVNTEFV